MVAPPVVRSMNYKNWSNLTKRHLQIQFNSSSFPMTTHSRGCGIGRWRPEFLQRLATTRAFLVVYGLLGTIQSMAYVYWVATLTTFEKRFRIPSKTTGLMLSGNEISQILLSLLLTYFGGQRNRPLWIAWGVAISAASCYVLVLPHLIYGPGDAALSLTEEHLAGPLENQDERQGLCIENWKQPNCTVLTGGEYSKAPSLLVFLSQFILGIGSTLYFALGQTYIDDNTKKENTPFYLGVTLSLRTVGPAFGFLFSYICLSLYIDPTLTPTIDRKDPRWLGAWWLGWLLLGTIMFLFSIFISMFPKHLSKSKQKEINENEITKATADQEKNSVSKGQVALDASEEKPPTLKEFPAALKRLSENKLLMINIFSGVFYILGASGYMTYFNKIIEILFSRTAAETSLVIGPITLFCFMCGFFVSGTVISKFKPRPLYVLGWNVFVGGIYILAEIAFIFLSCSDSPIVGYNSLNNSINVINSCNVDCGCQGLKYAPVCFKQAGVTFYTACHAGCSSSVTVDNITRYENCSCAAEDDILSMYLTPQNITEAPIVEQGACSSHCGYNFIIFIIVSCIMHTIGSSGKIGNILVNYRAVHPNDKAFAQGLFLLLVSLLAFIPGPIIFGYIIDSTCLMWDESCGSQGNCWLYDKPAFRLRLNLTAAGLTLIGTLLDGVVCYLGRDLKLYAESQDVLPEPPPRPSSPNPDSDNEEGPLKPKICKIILK